MKLHDPYFVSSVCPSLEDLVAFDSGNLDVPQLLQIGVHIAQCSRCLRVLDDAAGVENGQLQDLRRSLQDPAPEAFGADPEYMRMCDRAKQFFANPAEPPQPASQAATSQPIILGQYRILEKIGQGGMGTVYRALHVRLKKQFAIKLLAADRIADSRAVARFQREMEAVGRLDHANIVRATDAGEADGVHFLVMELIDGLDLSRLVRLAGPLGAADACALVRGAANGLQNAHEHKLVHRDIKPSNLLLSMKGEVKILDLGLARFLLAGKASDELTGFGELMGTADYMAPEQWQASHNVDIRADLYSLGCTLYFLLAGKAPFADHQGRPQKMAAHLNAAAPPFGAICADFSDALGAILKRLLAKNPADRYATPADVAQALEPFCAEADLSALARRAADMGEQDLAGRVDGSTAEVARNPSAPTPGGPSKSTIRSKAWSAGRRRLLIAFAAGTLALIVVGLALIGGGLIPPFRPTTLPVGNAPGSVLTAGKWNDLLDREPTEFYRFDPARESHWAFDPAGKKVHVQTGHLMLLSLGKVEAPGYTLQLDLRQEPWTGGVGMFFGGRREPGSGKITFRFIELRSAPHVPATSFVLHRGLGTLEPQPGMRPKYVDIGMGGWPLIRSPGGRPVNLQIEVNERGLTEVQWDGASCDSLFKLKGATPQNNPKANGPVLEKEDFQGEFGLYCDGGSAQLYSAKLFLNK